MKYLVIKCEEVSCGYEETIEYDPICITDDYSKYDMLGYEVYEIADDGSLKKIRDYEEVKERYIAYCKYINDNHLASPIEVIKLKSGDRNDITEEDVKKWSDEFGFVEDVMKELRWYAAHGEEIDGYWCVIGEAYDSCYPTGI